MDTYKLELTRYEAESLHVAARLRLESIGIQMTGHEPKAIGSLADIDSWYAENSHMDSLVRLYVRLSRALLGHKQYNAPIAYTPKP